MKKMFLATCLLFCYSIFAQEFDLPGAPEVEDISITPSRYVQQGTTVRLTPIVKGNGPFTYYWNIGGFEKYDEFTTSTALFIDRTMNQLGSFNVNLRVRDREGLEGQLMQHVFIQVTPKEQGPQSPPQGIVCYDVHGNNKIHINFAGTAFSASYTYGNEVGVIDMGQIQGHRLTGRWYVPNDPQKGWGSIVFDFNEDWSAFSGLWGHGQNSPNQAWSGYKGNCQ